MLRKEEKNGGVRTWFGLIKKTITVIGFVFSTAITLLMLFLFATFFVAVFGSFLPLQGGNIEVIPLYGVISTTGDAGLLSEKATVSEKIVNELKSADKNAQLKGIVLEINSPGGGAVASYEIMQAVKKMHKPVVAVIRESGASGAFWVATAAEKIFVNPMSITGSIGVVASHLEFAGLLKDYNVTYRRLIAGKYKDAGSPYREMSVAEQQLYQHILDKLHDEFIVSVADNRHLSVDAVRQIADGFVLLGSEAKDKKLVDDFGGRDDAIQYLEKKLNITGEVFEYKEHGALKDLLTGKVETLGFWIGQGIGSLALSRERTQITV